MKNNQVNFRTNDQKRIHQLTEYANEQRRLYGDRRRHNEAQIISAALASVQADADFLAALDAVITKD